MRKWNAGQQAAISARARQILVSASAGTGKTAVLVERVVSRVLEEDSPLEMDQFLLVTFTNAAAAEMRERISQALLQRQEAAPSQERIQRQLLLLGKAAIGTLHAFCLDLVRQNYALIGVDPQCRILNEVEQQLVKQEALDEVLEQHYEAGDEAFLELTQCFGGDKNDDPLRKLILQVYDAAISQPLTDQWLDQSVALFEYYRGSEESSSPEALKEGLTYLPLLLQQTLDQINTAVQALTEAYDLAAQYPILKGYLTLIQSEIGCLKAISKFPTWDQLQSAICQEQVIFGRLPSVTTKQHKLESEAEYVERVIKQNQVKALRQGAKEGIKNLQKGLKGLTTGQMVAEIQQMSTAMLALVSLVKAFIAHYQKSKQEKTAMDFNDIEHWAFILLIDQAGQPTELAKNLQSRFAEVLVDEYQDINPMQEALLQAVSQIGSFFMVGDVKQSIYGFRQAEPQLFLTKYHHFKETESGQVVQLSDNYRSNPAIIDGINQLFDLIMTAYLSGLEYQTEGRLTCGLLPNVTTDAPAMELHILDKNSETSESDASWSEEQDTEADPSSAASEEQEVPEGVEAEAWLAGQRILELMKTPIWDRKLGKTRFPSFRDVVVLLPAVRKVAPVFVNALRQQGIPVYADMGTGYFGAQEIQTVVSFLKVVENPRQDIPLAALLLSPAIGFNPQELAQIRLQRRKVTLYESLVWTARRGKPEIKQPVREFLKTLKQFRHQAKNDSIENLLLMFYEKTGFLQLCGAMPEGMQRQANLWAMVQKARQFEESHTQGLYYFIKFLAGLEKSHTDLSAAAILGEKDDVVRIMTIHKSKGLEFPIVIIGTAGRRFNMKSLQQDVLIHRRWGLGPLAVEIEARIKYPTGLQRAIKGALQEEALAEELRLLYVAMTRAQEKLIIIGRLNKAEEKLAIWQQHKEPPLATARSFMDWLGMGLSRLQQDQLEKSWSLKIWQQADLNKLAIEAKELSPLWQSLLATPLTEEEETIWAFLRQRLLWSYPYQAAVDLPGKLSVTQAKGRLYPEQEDRSATQAWQPSAGSLAEYLEQPALRPQFILEAAKSPEEAAVSEPKRLTGAERGTLMHKVLAKLDLSVPWPATTLSEQINTFLDDLVYREIIKLSERQLLTWQPFAAFLTSPLSQRMQLASSSLRCEATFTMLIPAQRLYPELLEGPAVELPAGVAEDEVIVQGTIDAYFVEDDQLVLVDYKSDQLKPGQEQRLLERYRGQMALYAEALTISTGMSVKETWLYSLALNQGLLLN